LLVVVVAVLAVAAVAELVVSVPMLLVKLLAVAHQQKRACR
jgi:hypothetical protein